MQVGSHIRNLQPLVIKMHVSKCTGLQNNAHQLCYACGSLHLPTSCTLRTLLKMRQVCNAQCFFLVWYSRNSENNTSKYPDLAADVPKLLKQGCKSVVLDCEAVAYDRITKKILPFQVSVLLQCQAVNK